MTPLSGAFFLSLLLCIVVHCAEIHTPLDCQGRSEHAAACAQPADSIVAIAPGLSYLVSIACHDCPYVKSSWTADHKPLRTDQILLLNLTLAADNRTILLNDETVYPLPTIPTPPQFWVTQRPHPFSNANLTSGLACPDPYCKGDDTHSVCKAWCTDLRLSSLQIDYLYTVEPSQHGGADHSPTRYWEVTMEVIGGKAGTGFPHWKFDKAAQQSLWFLVRGTPVQRGKAGGPKDSGGASDLFGAGSKESSVYEYRIVNLRLGPGTYKFPSEKPLTIWQTMGRFLGADVWQEEGKRFLYLDEDWGDYGKTGTLRNSFGRFIHWNGWFIFWYIFLSSIAALVLVIGGYRLYFWAQQQKQLMFWDGMDNVWDRLRHEPQADEGASLLPGAYQDEPGSSSSSAPSRYTDEPLSMKPLPSKPLPEKPLPSVPLIDT